LINVIVVDDSALMRRVVSDILNSDPEIRVVDTAMNGKYALEKIKKLNPHVVTMDLMMPEIDGIAAVQRIMKEYPTRIVMLSAYTIENSKLTLDALKAGAIDFIRKPSGEISPDIDDVRDEIITKIKAAAKANIPRLTKQRKQVHHFSSAGKKIIVIGASTGGPQTLEVLLPQIPGNIPASIIVVQHMPAEFTGSFADRLDSLCDLDVREAADSDELKDGVVFIAPGGCDIELMSGDYDSKTRIRLIKSEPKQGAKPNIDGLFRSAAEIYMENTVGIILTGMADDGTTGCREIKGVNGTVIAESDESSIVYSMPKSVIEAGLADKIVRIDKIAAALVRLFDL